jgi:hypothetical protein
MLPRFSGLLKVLRWKELSELPVQPLPRLLRPHRALPLLPQMQKVMTMMHQSQQRRRHRHRLPRQRLDLAGCQPRKRLLSRCLSMQQRPRRSLARWKRL